MANSEAVPSLVYTSKATQQDAVLNKQFKMVPKNTEFQANQGLHKNYMY